MKKNNNCTLIFRFVFVFFLDIALWLLSQYRYYLLICIFVSVACMIYRRLSVLGSRRLAFACFLLTFLPPTVFAFVSCTHNSLHRLPLYNAAFRQGKQAVPHHFFFVGRYRLFGMSFGYRHILLISCFSYFCS